MAIGRNASGDLEPESIEWISMIDTESFDVEGVGDSAWIQAAVE